MNAGVYAQTLLATSSKIGIFDNNFALVERTTLIDVDVLFDNATKFDPSVVGQPLENRAH